MLWKCLGEKHVLPNLTDLDELKMNKVILENGGKLGTRELGAVRLDQRVRGKGDSPQSSR